LLVKDAGTVDVELYRGSPGDWNLQTNLRESGVYPKWDELYLGQETRYIRFMFKGAPGRIGEVTLFSSTRKLDISLLIGERGDHRGLNSPATYCTICTIGC